MPKIPWDLIVTVVVAIIGSSWFANLVNNRSKYSNKAVMERLNSMEAERKQDKWERAKDKADDCRRRILTFDGQIRRGIKHTEEEYNNNNRDVDFYKNFCKDNPKYPNTQAVSAIEHSTKDYQERLKTNDFLK